MTKRIKIIAIIVSMAVLAVIITQVNACVKDTRSVREWTVQEKRFEPAHTSTRMQITQVGDTTVTIPVTEYEPDRWRVKVTGISESGKVRSRWIIVSEKEYESIRTGDRYGED